jgi:hypothetical protein
MRAWILACLIPAVALAWIPFAARAANPPPPAPASEPGVLGWLNQVQRAMDGTAAQVAEVLKQATTGIPAPAKAPAKAPATPLAKRAEAGAGPAPAPPVAVAAAVPFEGGQWSSPDGLAGSQYLGEASLVMEGIRRLHGGQPGAPDPMAAEWAPFFTMPTEGTRADLNALLPVVTEMVGLQAAVASSATAFDAAWEEAVTAAGVESEEGARQALEMAAMHKAELESQQARLVQLGQKAKAIGPLRDPVKEYRRVGAEHEAHARTLQALAPQPVAAVPGKPPPPAASAPCTSPYGDCEVTNVQHVNVGDQPKALINPVALAVCRQENEAAQLAYQKCLDAKTVVCRAPVPDPYCDGPGASVQNTVPAPAPAAAAAASSTETQKQQRILEIEANLEIIQQNLSRDQADLGKETNQDRRASLQFRILQAQSDLAAEKDLKTSLETGQLVHTRSPFDDYAHDQFVEKIRVNQQAMEQFQNASDGLQRLAYLLPPGEADAARAFIARQVTPEDRSKLNMTKLREIAHALNFKVQGFQGLQQARDEEAAARASMYMEMAQNIKDAADGGMQACSLLGGRGLSLAYSAATGYAGGGGTGSLIQVAASLTTPTALALTAFQGYQEGGWSGAGQSLAISYVTGKATTYALGKAMSLGGRPPATGTVKEVKDLARFNEARTTGIARAKEFQKMNEEALRLAKLAQRGDPSAARRLADLERTMEDKATTIQTDMHAKSFLKYKGSVYTQKAFNGSIGSVHAKVQERFHEMMQQKPMQWSPTKLKEFRNSSSAGTVGMDFDIGLDPSQARSLLKGGKPATQHEWQTDAQKAWNKSYVEVTGRDPERSWETVTTTIHPEAYKDLNMLGQDRSKVSKLWAGQSADVTRYKMLHLSRSPLLSEMEKLQEISRGTSKDMTTKLLPLMKKTPSSTAASAEAMAAAKQHWTKVNSVLEAFGRGDIDSVNASRRIRELTGGKSIREVVDETSTLMESLIKRTGQ